MPCLVASDLGLHCLPRSQKWDAGHERVKHLSHDMTKPRKWVCTQQRLRFSLGICPDWSESPLCAQWELRTQCFSMRTAKTDQTGRMPRLIWVFAGRTVALLVLSCRGSFLETIATLILLGENVSKSRFMINIIDHYRENVIRTTPKCIKYLIDTTFWPPLAFFKLKNKFTSIDINLTQRIVSGIKINDHWKSVILKI